jgi:DNA-binding CsgD family transcriptional regulator
MQTAPEYQARIAQEVAARYGVPVMPDAVKIVPRGVSIAPEYRWDGRALVAVEPKPHGQAIREKINASYKEAARKRRLAKAETLTVQQVSAARSVAMAAQIERTKALARERAEGIRAIAALPGATYTTIGAHMGISRDSAKKYCQLYEIVPVASDNHRKAREQERLAKARAFMAGGDRTSQDLAALLGISANAAGHYIRAHGLPFRYVDRSENPTKAARLEQLARDRAAKAQLRREEWERSVADRRERVRAMFCAGLDAGKIAAAIGCSRGPIWKDIQAMGLRREDYPVPSKTRERKERVRRQRLSLEERRAKVVQMRADGMHVKAIAYALGCSYQAVQRDMQAAGVTTPPPPRGYVGSPAIVGRVAAMRARKMSTREIAIALEVSKTTAARLVRSLEAA